MTAEIRLRHFENLTELKCIESKDRYLFQSPAPDIQLGLVGTGTIGMEHIRVCALEGRARIRSLYDTSTNSLTLAQKYTHKMQASQPLICDELSQMCTDATHNALLICTPNYTHRQIMEALAPSGKAIYLEKPMAHTLVDAYAICQLAATHAAPVHIGLQYRYKSNYALALKEILRNNSLGQIHHIAMQEHRPPFLDKVNQWNKFAKLSGGTFIEKCCHYFNLMHIIANSQPVSVFATGAQAVNFKNFERSGQTADIIDHGFVTIEFANGSQAHLDLCMFSPTFHEALNVCGELGRLNAQEEWNPILQTHKANRVEIQHHETQSSQSTETQYADYIANSGHGGATYFAHKAFIEDIIRWQQMMSSGMSPVDQQSITNANILRATESFWSIAIGSAAQASIVAKKPIDLLEHIASQGIDTHCPLLNSMHPQESMLQ